MKPKQMLKLEYFCARLDEGWKVVETYIRSRSIQLSGENFARIALLESSQHPVSSERRMLLSSGYRVGISHLRVLRPTSGEKGGKIGVTFLLLPFSQRPSASNV